MSLGTAGVVAGVLFKKFIDDSKTDKEYFRNEIKDTREKFYNELQLLREDAQKDREIYIESIEKITNKVDVINTRINVIESDIKDIKGKL